MSRKLRVANSHYHVAHLLAPTIAYEWGFFEQEGVGEVEIVGGGLVPAFVERVALATAAHEKGIDIIVDARPPAIFWANSQGKGWYIVGCWRSQMPFKFFAIPEITSLQQLAGRKVARRDQGCISSTALSFQLETVGMDPATDVEWVSGYPTVPHHAADALLAGKVDCAPVPANYAPRVKERGFVEIIDMQSVYAEGRPDRIIAATEACINEQGQRLQGFLRAMVRAYWMLRNTKYLPYVTALDQRLRKDSYAAQEQYEWTAPDVLESLPFPIDGKPPVRGLERLAVESQRLSELPAEYDFRSSLRLELIDSAFAELSARPELAGELREMEAIVSRWGY